MKVRGILETIIYTRDLAAVEPFYRDVLGLNIVAREDGKFLFFQCGARMFLLFNPNETIEQTNLPPHGAHGPQHVAFAIPVTELDQWRERLTEQGIAIEQEVTWKNGNRSIYCRDPAGNSVEFASPVTWNLPETF